MFQGEKMRLCGFLPELAHLRPWQWQGKIHSQIVEGPDGAMYFTTDGGESREEYLMNHPQGYNGGFFFRWEPGEDRLTMLGQGLRYDSIKDLQISRKSGLIMAVSYPQAHLLTYDWKKNELKDHGRVNASHVSRVFWSDRYGNIYYVDYRQRMIKYEHDTGKLLFSADSLPAWDGTTGSKVITGVTAWAEDRTDGTIYLVTYGAKMIRFTPARLGLGKVEDLGSLYDDPQQEPYTYYCPNLAYSQETRKLYYFLGGHGNYAIQNTSVLMEFDPRTGQKQIAAKFPLSEINEVTGADVKDIHGNLYFCARRDDAQAELRGESGASRPFMLILNPSRVLKPRTGTE